MLCSTMAQVGRDQPLSRNPGELKGLALHQYLISIC